MSSNTHPSWKRRALIASLVINVASAIAIQLATSFGGGELTVFSWKNDFYDLITIAVIQLVMIPIILVTGVKYGKKTAHLDRWQNATHHKRMSSQSEAEMGLLSSDEEHVSMKDQQHLDDQATKYANYTKYGATTFLFVFLTICQVLVGIKTISFHFAEAPSERFIQVFFVFAIILWINVQLWTSRQILDESTREEVLYFPFVHLHPLSPVADATYHSCDVCSKTIKKEGSFQCTSGCDFDLCLACTKKVQDGKVDGVLRTDKGPVQEIRISSWQYIKKGLSFAHSQKHIIFGALIFLMASSLIDVWLPNLQGSLINDVISLNQDHFAFNIALYVGLSIGAGISGGLKTLLFGLASKKMNYEVHRQLVHSIYKQDIAFFDGITTGDLGNRFWTDSEAMLSPVQQVLSSSLSSILILVGGTVMCLYTSWRLSILALTTMGPITLIFRIYSEWSSGINGQIWKALALSYSTAIEGFKNIRTVRAFSREEQEEIKFQKSRKYTLDRGITDAYVSGVTNCLTSYADVSLSIFILWYGGKLAMESPEVLTVGNLVTFQLYWNLMSTNFNTLTGFLNSFTKAASAAQRVISILECQPAIDPMHGVDIPRVNGDIELRDVEFTYQLRPEEKVLKGFNLKIKPGQVCALVGRSGAGKSTLVQLLLRYYDPQKGDIIIDGTNLRDINPRSYCRCIGVVSQETQLFNATIEENIAYGVTDYTHEQLIAASTDANVHQFVSEFPEGYQTKVGESGQRLSGGQKQRLALARCFLKSPSLLLLDEATSALDGESEAAVQEGIDKLIASKKCTVILVAHRLSTVINADTIAVVDGGRVVEQGNHESLLEMGGIYAKLVRKQVTKMQNTLPEMQQTGSTPSDSIDSLLDQPDS
eukprot:TRINITY_DN4132_c0_g1_i1.p1 TRINITY_DN4132_c0_g1~~TRINITY_DN4132_c0_g1_i1.p1  ORF type:complete len:878 (-),score=215.90 TRINITY_DN4132_c0_g1_i1:50-2683(-)